MSGSPIRTQVRLSAEWRAEIAAQRAAALRVREQARVAAREERAKGRVVSGQRKQAARTARRHEAAHAKVARLSARTARPAAGSEPVERMDDVAARAQAVRAEVVNEAASAAVREQAEAIVQRADAAIEATHAAETDGARPDLPALEQEVAALERAADNDLDARLYRIAVAKGIMKGLPPELTARADSLRETPDGLLFEVSTTGGRMGVAIEGEGDGTRVVLDVKRAKLDGTRKVGGRLVTGCAAEQSVGEEILRVAASYGVEHGRIERDEGPRAARQHATRVQEAGRR